MSPKQDDRLVEELSDSLRLRAQAIQSPAAELDEVRARAGRIRARRRAGAAVAAAACLAVATPVALSVTSGDAGTDDLPVAPPGPSPTQVSEGTPPGPQELGIFGLPVGAEPAVAWMRDGVVHFPDGTRVSPDLPGRVTAFHYLAGSDRYVFALSDDSGEQTVQVRDGIGARGWGGVSSGALAVGDDGTQVAWATPAGEMMVLSEDQSEPATLGRFPGSGADRDVRAAALVGDCRAAGEGCTVFATLASPSGAAPEAWTMTSTGETARLDSDPPMLAVTDAFRRGTLGDRAADSTGLVAGIIEILDDGSCSRVDDQFRFDGAEGGQFETCENSLGDFSPDGALIEAGPAYRSGAGDGEIGMYDVATGQRLWRRMASEEQQAFIAATVWEDEQHLLATVQQQGRWAVIRLGVDGSIEQALPPVPGDEVEPAYLLETRP